MSLGKLLATLALVAAALLVAAAQGKVTEFAPGVISIASLFQGADAPAFAPDGTTVVFDRMRTRRDSTLYISHRVAGRWRAPRVAPFSGRWIDQDPAMAPDGSYLIFASNRPRTPAGKPSPGWSGYLWRVNRRPHGVWGRPVWLPAVVNADARRYAPSIARNGDLYFVTTSGDQVARFRHGHYLAPVPVRVPGFGRIGDPAIAPDESFLVFRAARNRKSGLFLAFRRGDGWGPATDLGPEVNLGNDWDERVSPGGRTLYFTSDRSGHPAVWRVSLAPWLRR